MKFFLIVACAIVYCSGAATNRSGLYDYDSFEVGHSLKPWICNGCTPKQDLLVEIEYLQRLACAHYNEDCIEKLREQQQLHVTRNQVKKCHNLPDESYKGREDDVRLCTKLIIDSSSQNFYCATHGKGYKACTYGRDIENLTEMSKKEFDDLLDHISKRIDYYCDRYALFGNGNSKTDSDEDYDGPEKHF